MRYTKDKRKILNCLNCSYAQGSSLTIGLYFLSFPISLFPHFPTITIFFFMFPFGFSIFHWLFSFKEKEFKSWLTAETNNCNDWNQTYTSTFLCRKMEERQTFLPAAAPQTKRALSAAVRPHIARSWGPNGWLPECVYVCVMTILYTAVLSLLKQSSNANTHLHTPDNLSSAWFSLLMEHIKLTQ